MNSSSQDYNDGYHDGFYAGHSDECRKVMTLTSEVSRLQRELAIASESLMNQAETIQSYQTNPEPELGWFVETDEYGFQGPFPTEQKAEDFANHQEFGSVVSRPRATGKDATIAMISQQLADKKEIIRRLTAVLLPSKA